LNLQEVIKAWIFEHGGPCFLGFRVRSPEETFVIGSAGRLCPVKDYTFMIEIAKAVREETKYIKFHL
jgi:glycosyltransferase involved in cell wall biosynthesis